MHVRQRHHLLHKEDKFSEYSLVRKHVQVHGPPAFCFEAASQKVASINIRIGLTPLRIGTRAAWATLRAIFSARACRRHFSSLYRLSSALGAWGGTLPKRQ